MFVVSRVPYITTSMENLRPLIHIFDNLHWMDRLLRVRERKIYDIVHEMSFKNIFNKPKKNVNCHIILCVNRCNPTYNGIIGYS